MKVRDCSTCRKHIAEQMKNEYLKNQYAVFSDVAYTMAVYSTVAVLTAQVRRGRSKEYIHKLFDELVMIYDTPEIFGKAITLTDMRESLEKEYGLDFSRIKVHIEDEKEFLKDVKSKGVR